MFISGGGIHLQICFFGGNSFHFIGIQTKSFLIVVSEHINATHEEAGKTRKRESRKHENEKVAK